MAGDARNGDGDEGGSSRRPQPIDKDIGQQLRHLRKRAGQSQEWLAGQLGITYQQLGKYERGESSLKVWMMMQAARLLGSSGAALVEAVAPASGFAEERSFYESGTTDIRRDLEETVRRLNAVIERLP